MISKRQERAHELGTDYCEQFYEGPCPEGEVCVANAFADGYLTAVADLIPDEIRARFDQTKKDWAKSFNVKEGELRSMTTKDLKRLVNIVAEESFEQGHAFGLLSALKMKNSSNG